MRMDEFNNKIVVITGATSGIGAAAARLFGQEGCNVILVGRNEVRGSAVEREIAKKGGHAVFKKCDVTDVTDCENLKNWVTELYGGVDILFNNAGIFITETLEDMNFQELDQSFKTNLYGTIYLTKFLMELLIKKHGCIINTASVSGLESFTSGTKNYMYGMSKAALVKFTKQCALNYAGRVRVNAICPGIVDTEIFTNRDFSRFDGVIPMGRIARPEEIAKVVRWLASEDAAYITGAILPVDGGMSLK